MRIRLKLLILLMLISLAPLLVVRTSIQRNLTQMGDNLAERSENVLVHKASTGLKRIVEDHARVLRRERQLLESMSLLLASRIEGVLYGHAHIAHESVFMPPNVGMQDVQKDYFFLHMRGSQQPLEVDFQQIGVDNSADSSISMESLIPLLGTVKFEYPKLILWIEMTLADGTRATYPKANNRRRMRRSPVIDKTSSRLQGGLSWSLPRQDPQTRRMVFKVTAPIRDDKGKLQGNLSIVVPVDSLFHENIHVSMFSNNAESLLVQSVVDPENDSSRLRIVAQAQAKQTGRGHWQVPEGDKWLIGEDAEQYGIMTTAIRARKPGVVGMPYKDGDALWAYASIDESGTSLLLIVPKEDIVKEAHAARQYVEAQVDDHNRTMGYVVFAVAGLVLVLALLLSKLFTRNITELVDAVRSVSKGNFAARVTVRSTDEIGQLGLAINKMVPELQDRVAMKNHLEVAQEVQQSLLPSENPVFAGIDIAATSTYCDETGGDYYGFIPRTTVDGESLVVAVGDVSGHGFQAALMMASARAYLRSQATSDKSLSEVVSAVNELVSEDVDDSGRFMTLFLLELTEDGTAKWVRAGHDPALLYDPAIDQFEELMGEGLPLGVIADAQFDINQRSGLRSGQIIIIGTDGIWETRSEAGEMFGKERLKDVIREHCRGESARLIEALSMALADFRGDAEQLDDVTLAAIKIG